MVDENTLEEPVRAFFKQADEPERELHRGPETCQIEPPAHREQTHRTSGATKNSTQVSNAVSAAEPQHLPATTLQNGGNNREEELEKSQQREKKEYLSRLHLEGLLQESRHFSDALLETSPIPIVITGLDTAINYVNPSFESITGFTRQELIGVKSPYPWWPEERTPLYEAENIQGRRLALNIQERVFRKKNGERMTVVLYIKPFTDKKGKQLFYVGYWMDITERKKAEEEIRQNQERMQKLFRLMAEGAIVWDSSLHIIEANTEAERIFGVSREQITGQPYDFSGWSVRPNFEHIRADGTPMPLEEMAAFRARNERREIRNVILGHKWPDGKIIWLNTSAVPVFDSHGRIDCILCTFTDITREKILRDEREHYLAQITRAQENERKRISRELHDDTAQYLALTSLEIDALIEHQSSLPAEVQLKLKNLRSMINRTIQEIRRFSHELHPGVLEQLGLVPALELIIGEYNEKCEPKARFRITGAERRLADEVELALFRITQECLNNIRKHSQATTADVLLRFFKNKVRLEVKDNGKGFNIETESQAAAKRGSLGLISMKERAFLVGADIRITSAPKRGTAITVELKC